MLKEQLTKEDLSEKTDREIQELQLRYLAETKYYARKAYNNTSFFFWLTIAVFVITALIYINAQKNGL